ncbi:MAG TPA: flagellar basal body rod protein FlgC [Chromatiales bacterium]|nr:flagellar basal body rod protein FlgC [Thiotrichales bacterium]HIP67623.1 flagellar basal body rod protein FlgC [Chromatiales bacterium]
MSLFKVFDIAGSGMSAQNIRLNTTASNMANADSVASKPEEAYKSRQAVFSAMLQNSFDQNSGSVGVQTLGIVESQAEHNMRFEPDHPLANEEGYVFESNVNTIEEMANMISASRSYQTNIEVLNTSKKLLLQTIKLGE